jgi:glucose/arabinose dehydrogenase
MKKRNEFLKRSWIKTVGLLLFVVPAVLMAARSVGSEKSADKLNLADLKLDTVVTGLKMPWAVAFLPDGNMLVTERLSGQLRIVKDGVLESQPVKGVPKVVGKGQGGLLDVVLHPDYKKNGWIYISYSAPAEDGGAGANTALLRGKLKDGELVEQQLLFKAKPNPTGGNHFAGRIAFDKKGYVFLTVGERGQKEKAQDLGTHQGKVIRLHDDGRVPKDNPFVGKSGALPEIYSYGHRNMQGLAIHPSTGAIWEHEHGPQGGDEVNIVEKGKNYGWPLITFGIDYDNSVISEDTARAGMEQPVIYWKPSIAPCGMTFVTSDKFKDWKGDLLVGSLKFHYLKHCVVKGNKIVRQETIFEKIGRVRDVRQGPDGNIYVVLENTGKIVRISPGN